MKHISKQKTNHSSDNNALLQYCQVDRAVQARIEREHYI